MIRFRYLLFLAGLSVAIPFVLTKPAYAYLDPGTMGMILQLMVGAVVGGLVAIKIYWYRLKAFFLQYGKASKLPKDPNNS